MRRLLMALLAFFLAFCAAEFFLRWRESSVAAKEFIEAGLFQYDPELGWRLAPLARGRHVTADYDVIYTTDTDGFRTDAARRGTGPVTLVLGDSFTFGFGVADTETFVHLLNSDASDAAAWMNRGVPGYSTDQELLLLERELQSLRPHRVVVIVCLINDLFDNAFPFPLQAPNAKPWFEKSGEALVLRNTPVSTAPRRGADAKRDLASVVGIHSWSRSRLVGTALDAAGFRGEANDARYAPYVELFGAISRRMRDACAGAGSELAFVLLPGQALARGTDTMSGRYQESLRQGARAELEALGITVVDATGTLQAGRTEEFYFRFDGHLTAAGHAAVAGLLANAFQLRASAAP